MIPELNYAAFVWSSYGVFAAVCAWQFLSPMIRRRQLVRQIREQIQEQHALQNLQQQHAAATLKEPTS